MLLVFAKDMACDAELVLFVAGSVHMMGERGQTSQDGLAMHCCHFRGICWTADKARPWTCGSVVYKCLMPAVAERMEERSCWQMGMAYLIRHISIFVITKQITIRMGPHP